MDGVSLFVMRQRTQSRVEPDAGKRPATSVERMLERAAESETARASSGGDGGAKTNETAATVRGNHSSNTTCLTHAFFKSGEECSKL